MESLVLLAVNFVAIAIGNFVLTTIQKTPTVFGAYYFTINNQSFLVEYSKKQVDEMPTSGRNVISFGPFVKSTFMRNGIGSGLSNIQGLPCADMKGNFLKSSVPNYDVSLGSNQQILESNDATVVIFNSDFRVDGYNFAFETSDGNEKTGPVTENEAISVTGSFSFVGDDGQTYTVDYVADENGFQPSGTHIPATPNQCFI